MSNQDFIIIKRINRAISDKRFFSLRSNEKKYGKWLFAFGSCFTYKGDCLNNCNLH